MTERREVLLGGPFEQRIGFARAVRVGDFVAVGGTASIGEVQKVINNFLGQQSLC